MNRHAGTVQDSDYQQHRPQKQQPVLRWRLTTVVHGTTAVWRGRLWQLLKYTYPRYKLVVTRLREAVQTRYICEAISLSQAQPTPAAAM